MRKKFTLNYQVNINKQIKAIFLSYIYIYIFILSRKSPTNYDKRLRHVNCKKNRRLKRGLPDLSSLAITMATLNIDFKKSLSDQYTGLKRAIIKTAYRYVYTVL